MYTFRDLENKNDLKYLRAKRFKSKSYLITKFVLFYIINKTHRSCGKLGPKVNLLLKLISSL